ATAGASCAIVLLRRFGTQATTARCRTLSRTAANPVCSRADFVTARQDPAVRRTQILQGCRRATSSSRWPTSRAAREVQPSRREPERAWTAAKHCWSFTELHVPAAL